MQHKNFHSFEANTHFDLGLAMGKKFKSEASLALENNNDPEFKDRVATSQMMLPLTQEHFPEYVDEIRGYAEGAGIDFEKMFAIAIEDDAYIKKVGSKCTTMITNGGKLLAHSEDNFEAGSENDVCIIKKEINGLTTLEIYYYNTLGGVSVGINSNGYACSLNTLIDKPQQIGIPKCFVSRKFLDTNNPVSDYEKIKNLKLADGYNHNIIDLEGKITNIELSINETNISFPNSPFSHTNHCLFLKNTSANDNIAGTLTRLKEAAKVPPKVTIEEAQKRLDDDSLGDNVSIYNKRTVGRMIVDFDNLTCYIWLRREKELGWVEYPIDFIKA